MGSSSYFPATPDDPSLFLSDVLSDPASPSVFLDLPPTPHHPDDSDPDASSLEAEDLVLPYISRMLMEENIDDKFFYQYPEHPALLKAQQSFLDVLSTSDTPTPSSSSTSSDSSSAAAAASSAPTVWPYDPIELSQLQSHPYPFDGSDMLSSAAAADWPYDPLDARFSARDGSSETPDSVAKSLSPGGDVLSGEAVEASNLLFGEGPNSEMMNSAFLKGMEEASKFLPSQDKLVIDLEASTGQFLKGMEEAKKFLPSEDKLVIDSKGAAAMVRVKEEVDAVEGSGRGRKNRHVGEELEVEGGRSTKQTAVQVEDVGEHLQEMFDLVMLSGHEMCVKRMEELRIEMKNEASKNEGAGGKGNGKTRGRRGTREVVDLRTLLIHCAQAVATDDRRSATELLKQIKQHASPTGDATQRLACCFAEGLEARLAGTGSQVYQSLMAKRTSAVDLLNAYTLYMAAICFKKVAFMFSNQTIYNAALGKSKIHIVDYGIHYGFQWPCLLKRLKEREGGPPELRITGIDLPQPGFRPAERIEETGRRLSRYAQEFGVPFKYRAIAAKSETVRMEDLNIDPEEVLVVNCLYQFKNLMDESVVIDSPRDTVLNTIRKMKPHVFIHGVVNGSFSAPFFVTRFREALFYYSALFDILEATTPRESDQRLLIERDIFGRSALNVISCEGVERVERPETYKQWLVRNQRAGLKQLPLNREIVQTVREKVKKCYHKDFVIDEDHQWLLQGWKGRIIFALSTWVADDASSYF